MKKFFYKVGILIIILVASMIGRAILLGGVINSVTLEPAPALAGSIAQSLYSSDGSVALPAYGKDFTVANTRYFDSNQWVVTTVEPTHKQFNSGVVILERINNSYVVILGPGSAFESSFLLSMPSDVGQYLNTQGVIYNAAN